MDNNLKPKHVPNIRCPLCKSSFEVGRIQGGWMVRTCPVCGKQLSAEAYDAFAADKLQHCEQLRAKELEEKKIAKRHNTIAELLTNPLTLPLQYLLKRNSARHARKAHEASSLAVAAANEIDQAAMARYYTSEWYLCSGTALVSKEASPDAYLIIAKYSKGGAFTLKQKSGGNIAAGVVGEWQVFEELCRCIRRNEFLTGARLIPNAFLPSASSDIRGLADQTDLIVLTREAAFVCEVKNWRTHVKVSRRTEGLNIKTYKDDAKTLASDHDCQKPLAQLLQRMEDLQALVDYPEDRIFGLVIFVNPLSFEDACGGFRGGVRVVSCSADGSGTLASVVCEEIRYLQDVLAQADVDRLGDAMLASVVDRSGEMAQQQIKLRDTMLGQKRRERLISLADLSVGRRQAVFQKREDHGRRRDEAKSARRHNASKSDSRKQRNARKARLYQLEQEADEWGYR